MLAGIDFLNSNTLLCLIVGGSSKMMGIRQITALHLDYYLCSFSQKLQNDPRPTTAHRRVLKYSCLEVRF